MAYEHSGNAPVYVPNSGGRNWLDETGPVADGWGADGEMVRSAYAQRSNDDDFTQPGLLVREAFNDEQRTKLVDQAAGSLQGGVGEPHPSNTYTFWESYTAEDGVRHTKE